MTNPRLELVAAVQKRILEGFYEEPAVIHAAADKILEALEADEDA